MRHWPKHHIFSDSIVFKKNVYQSIKPTYAVKNIHYNACCVDRLFVGFTDWKRSGDELPYDGTSQMSQASWTDCKSAAKWCDLTYIKIMEKQLHTFYKAENENSAVKLKYNWKSKKNSLNTWSLHCVPLYPGIMAEFNKIQNDYQLLGVNSYRSSGREHTVKHIYSKSTAHD
jgi:hypothetical protein